jgi:thiosulfate/3-mercaptopyruvate sulfurtransferase
MNSRDKVLISAGELMRVNSGDDRPLILDVRWRLDQPDGRADYLAGHIPGAVYVSLEEELSDHRLAERGRHPLPSGPDLQAAARRWGLKDNQPVVTYDDWSRAGSARAWWVLTAAGLADVRILDGGLSAWTDAGGALQSGLTAPVPGDVTIIHDDLYIGSRAILSAQQISDGMAPTLLDARAPERFRGEAEPVDPVAGHIPGARNLPSTSVLASDGTFLPETGLINLFEQSDIDSCAQVGVYCGSGITASVLLAALTATGVDAALFPGSWSQWCTEPGRGAALGSA